MKEGEKNVQEVLDWYDTINLSFLDYISSTIKDSDVSNFYRYLLGFKNMLRSVEYCGKSSLLGIRLVLNLNADYKYMTDQ